MRPNIIYPTDDGAEAPRRIAAAHQHPLFLACLNRAWEDVLKRVRTHPQEVLLQTAAGGNTPLHEACRRNPPPAVVAALGVASRVRNDAGATPVHLAASHRCAAEALGALLDCAAAQNRGSSPCVDLTHTERAPIHYACMSFRGLDIEAFMLLLDRTLKDGFLARRREPSLGFEDMDDEEDDDDAFFDCQSTEAATTQKRVVLNVMAMKDSLGHTPLSLLFGRYRQRVRSVISAIDALRHDQQSLPQHASLRSLLTVRHELGELWEKARRIVARLTEARLEREGAAASAEGVWQPISPGTVAEQLTAAAWASEHHRGGVPSDEDVLPVYVDVADRDNSPSPVGNAAANPRHFRIVHSSVGLIGYGCPPEMIRLAISIHPHQVREMDEDGNLPLHIAVQASSYLGRYSDAETTEAAAAVVAASNFSDDASFISEATSFFSSATVSQTANPFDKVIKILLDHYPEAARIPQGESGQLPLIMAIKAGRRTWKDGIRTLLNAYPPALHNRRVIEPILYPKVLELVTNSSGAESTNAQRPTFRSRQIRRDNQSRTTLFELLRTKPEWLTAEGRGHA